MHTSDVRDLFKTVVTCDFGIVPSSVRPIRYTRPWQSKELTDKWRCVTLKADEKILYKTTVL